jgi:hypothetical protein
VGGTVVVAVVCVFYARERNVFFVAVLKMC